VDHRYNHVLELVAGGVSVRAACRRVGLPRSSFYAARELEAARGEVPAGRTALSSPDRKQTGCTPPDRDELLRRLDELSRGGSLRATELLLRETPVAAGVPGMGNTASSSSAIPAGVRAALDRARGRSLEATE
jgi:hypothetical protein